jgi:hypothetical protein
MIVSVGPDKSRKCPPGHGLFTGTIVRLNAAGSNGSAGAGFGAAVIVTVAVFGTGIEGRPAVAAAAHAARCWYAGCRAVNAG